MLTIVRCALLITIFLFRPVWADDAPPQDPSVACLSEVTANSEFSILRDKIPLPRSDGPSIEMLANKKKPSKADKVALSKLAVASNDCITHGNEWRQTHWHPQAIAIFDQFVIDQRASMADLYGGSVTYGQYCKAGDAALAKFKADIGALSQRIEAERKANEEQRAAQEQQRQRENEARNAEIARQNALADAQRDQAKRAAILQFMGMQQQQQAIQYQQQLNAIQQAAPRPAVRTNCYSTGSGMNCLSQ